MTVIYLRHSDDYSEQDSTYEHDARITRRGKSKARRKALLLCKKFGVPKVIVISPFYRARRTAKEMRSIIESEFHIRVRVKVDPSLGRFFTAEQRKKPDMRVDTVNLGAIIDSSEQEMLSRIRKHLKKVITKEYHLKSEVIWCISHGLILKKMLGILGEKEPEHVEFLESFMLNPKVRLSMKDSRD